MIEPIEEARAFFRRWWIGNRKPLEQPHRADGKTSAKGPRHSSAENEFRAAATDIEDQESHIRQLRIGDATLELIGPDNPDSPVATRPGGLANVTAFEVADLDSVVALARERGFSLPDATSGVLPDSRVSTISPDQLAGLALQLIEFGR